MKHRDIGLNRFTCVELYFQLFVTYTGKCATCVNNAFFKHLNVRLTHSKRVNRVTYVYVHPLTHVLRTSSNVKNWRFVKHTFTRPSVKRTFQEKLFLCMGYNM